MVSVCSLIISCGIVSFDEVSRVTSPNGKFDAIIVESNGGATTSFGYDIYIVKYGRKFKDSKRLLNIYGAVQNDNAYGVSITWQGSSTVILGYLKAKSIQKFSESTVIDGQTIELIVQSGVNNPSSPSGGMLYNLRKDQ
jgi:hypothetical protein